MHRLLLNLPRSLLVTLLICDGCKAQQPRDETATSRPAAAKKPARAPTPKTRARPQLDAATLGQLAAYVGAILDGSEPSSLALPNLASGRQATHVSLRRAGHLVADAWSDGPPTTSLPAALKQAQAKLADATAPDRVVIEFAYAFADLRDREHAFAGPLSNGYRGVRGFEVAGEHVAIQVPPTYLLASGDSFTEEYERVRRTEPFAALDDDALAKQTKLRRFDALQVLVTLDHPPRAVTMFRGNTIIEAKAVDEANTRTLAERAAAWLVAHVNDDGRMTYTWYPGKGRESDDNNMIRQWMASVALARWANFRSDPALHEVVARNIAYNLEHFYRQDENGLGYIEHRNRSKLGAIALAALAIFESSTRERFADQEAALYRTIESLWQPDGSFVTYYKPAGGTGGNNFYPGEALLYLAHRYTENRDPQLLERFMASFRYYRSWHLDAANRTPPFVPWHTQAYYKVWQVTRDPELEAFIFKMSDWLISSMQSWDDALYPDAAGQFFNPRRTQWGSENASSTGVYIEGIADAFSLADAVGDTRRRELYARSLSRALLHLYHLQIVDEVDTFYMPQPERAVGGIRTSMYRDFIRVDNVQHNLMGILKILDRFDAGDYHTEMPS